MVQGELWRQLLVVNLCASMTCLLDRLHQAGDGGRLMGARQEWMLRHVERIWVDREMIWGPG